MRERLREATHTIHRRYSWHSAKFDWSHAGHMSNPKRRRAGSFELETGKRKETEMKVKAKFVFLAAVVSCPSLAVRADNSAYPMAKLAQFVLSNMDVTSLPTAMRPKKEKGKKTFADYGFIAQKVAGNDAIISTEDGARELVIKVLASTPKGIYACFAEPSQNDDMAKTQRLILLKRKDPSGLLKGRESFRESAACPVIGGTDSTADSNGGD